MGLTDNRPQRSNSISNQTTSELLICFTSRLSSSSSSMKLPPSKSILSPGRPRDPSSQISLSTSLSRRLRTNGSLKGGQASPMFPAKKKGCAFENPEPSSPKVTCIGQVRVKSKKKGKRVKRSGGRSRGGEVSFRNVGEKENEGQCCNFRRNVKWVQFPLTICEGLRTFGSEINCFLPCRGWNSSCIWKEEEEEKSGAVFATWVVDDGQGKGRELEKKSYERHHIFEEIEFEEENIGEGEEGGGGRVSICIPPKNALLLMRFGSDPVKLASLATKFLEVPPVTLEEEEDDNQEEELEDEGKCVLGEVFGCERLASFELNEKENDQQVIFLEGEENEQEDGLKEHIQETSPKRISDVLEEEEEDPIEEILLDPELMEISIGLRSESEENELDGGEENWLTREGSDPEGEDPILPNCLLLMMCEPKLSMEVSKQTWVCSTDFIRWMPGARSRKKDGGDVPEKKKRTDLICQPLVVKCKENEDVGQNEKLEILLPRSSCHYPAQPPAKGGGESMASAIGKKLVEGKGYEPIVLTRCKSEPMRSAAKLVPDEGCIWKSRKLVPAATLGLGAAGVGF